ncbi:MAG: class I tRNA ligase family protein [Patescibacteria group bacterium]|nr:class I tRNA ligase family protein [Patescibacteria group bacterium]
MVKLKTGPDMPAKSETTKREEEILAFWKEHTIFDKSVAKEAPEGEFVFYDGPPFANGLPHIGHILGSSIKDAVGRYKTMRGYRVERRWGWDCHGLPIETYVEKKLGLKTKKDILTLGIDVFNETARSSVMQFDREWEKYIERIGRWVDFRNSYKTMDNSYIESVWWALKSLWEKGLLYEGRKVLMYCPHCETPLAKAEIAMDNTYKDITEEALTVRFKAKGKENEYFLAWTTTPWTLPGNVALAVNPEVQYVKVETPEGSLWLAADRVEAVAPGARILEKVSGAKLTGREYEPLYEIPSVSAHHGKKYVVLPAEFVTTHEGTGIVHTAVMYGEDDFKLGEKEGLPMVQLLDPGAHYTHEAPAFIQGQYIKKAEKVIKEDLEHRGLLFKREMHTHSYPHCYRCGTPLIYDAVASWFIAINAAPKGEKKTVKERMLEENERIRWVPEHLKEGRFRNIVEGAPDWTISRNRFWASPLPIWKEKKGNRVMIIGSLEELKRRTKRSGNRYFLMRHGEATHMLQGVYSDDFEGKHPLTEKGREQVREAAGAIPRGMPLVIIASPILRAQQTAEIMARELGVPEGEIVFDERLKEIRFGEFNEQPRKKYFDFIEQPDWYTALPKGGESLEEIKIRFGQALYDYEERYQNSIVLIVSHKVAFSSLFTAAAGLSGNEIFTLAEGMTAGPAEVREIPFVPLPVNKKFELDLHRPYTDSIVLLDDEGREYKRIPEVIDCWVESGAMPFAELHYPFDHEKEFKRRFPGDFIAEYIAQTRTWFYYMHAISVALFNSHAFRNVVSTGTVLAADGSKMSKSKGNYTDPLMLLERFGADALRFYLMAGPIMHGEDLAFRDEDIREVHNRVIGILWNSFKFFELYKHEYTPGIRAADSSNPLDRWARSRLGELMREVTDALDAYDTPRACRAVRMFVDDYSTWYVRRSRERVRGKDEADKQYALGTQRETLLTLAMLIAPIMPFIAESIYTGAGGEKESVHLEPWPAERAVDNTILADMTLIRAIASRALEVRERAGIRVRQPLGLLEARDLPEDEAVRTILSEEVNVKRVAHNPNLKEEVWLDTEITPELREEGVLRDVVRAIQDARKTHGLSVIDRPSLSVVTDVQGIAFLTKFKAQIIAATGLASLASKEGGEEHIGDISFPLVFEFS